MLENEDTPQRTRADIARENGAKSRGPTSDEGKANSRLNALKTGAYATHSILLANEDPAAYEQSLQALVRRFKPNDPYEFTLVRELCNTEWLLSRYQSINTNLMNLELARQEPEYDPDQGLFPDAVLTARAYQALAEHSRTLDQINRQIQHMHRNRARILADLAKARHAFPVPQRIPDLPPAAPLAATLSAEEPESAGCNPHSTTPEPPSILPGEKPWNNSLIRNEPRNAPPPPPNEAEK